MIDKTPERFKEEHPLVRLTVHEEGISLELMYQYEELEFAKKYEVLGVSSILYISRKEGDRNYLSDSRIYDLLSEIVDFRNDNSVLGQRL